jgi:predicted nucleic acid-binding protein
MGIAEAISGKHLYLDTNVFIYAVEGFSGLEDELRRLFSAVDAGRITATTSELTLAETLVKPFAEGNRDYQRAYRTLLRKRSFFQLEPVTRAILLAAARIRATTTLKLPDAIHLATAQSAGCDTLVTNDPDFRNAADMRVVMLSGLNREEAE